MIEVPCNLCGARDARVLFPATLDEDHLAPGADPFCCTYPGYGVHFAIVQCNRCGLIYANPRWEAGAILDEYEAVKDPLYLEEREGRVLTFQRHLRPLLEVYGRAPRPGERLLDVGCYVGVFLEVAQAAGWEAVGLEPSAWAVAEARQRGLAVIEGTLAAADLPAEHFDVVTMWDVVEHFADPLAELRRSHRILKPGGLLVLHTMDVHSPFARLMGRRWPWLMEMHLHYFSRRTLRAMLDRAGFDMVRYEPQGRYLRLGYLVTRVRPYSRAVAGALAWVIDRLNWRDKALSINFGDLVTAYARKR